MSDPSTGPSGLREAARIALLLSGNLLGGLVTVPLAPALPAMARDLGRGYDGALIAQLVMAVPGILIVVGGLLAAPLVAMFGKRRILQAGFVVYTLSGLAGLVAPDIPTMFAARIVVGLASGIVGSVAVSLIADFYEGAGRARMLGFATALGTLTASAGLFIGGFLVEQVGWRGPFLLYVLAFPPLLLVAGVVPAEAVGRARGRAPLPFAELLSCWHLYLALLFCTTLVFAKTTQGPFLLAALGVTNAALQGSILSVGLLLGAAAAASVFLVRRFLEPLAILLLALAAMGLALVGCGVVPPGIVPVAAMLLALAFFGGFTVPMFKVLVLDRTPAAARTAAAGALTAMIYAGQFVNPLIIKPASASFGLQGAFLALGLVVLAAVAGTAALLRLRGPAPAGRPVQ